MPTFCVLNVRLSGLTLAVPVSCCPVPDKGTDCVDPLVPPELSVSTRFAVRVPAAAGVKVISIAQVEFGAIERLAVQVVPVAVANSVGSAPVNEIGVAAKTRFAVPVFVTVTF